MIYGITMGDSSGVGPELVLQAARAGAITRPFVVYGDAAVLRRANEQLGYGLAVEAVATPTASRPGVVKVIDHGIVGVGDIRPGEISERSGLAARMYVESATRAALAGEIAAMVTLPINKEATRLSSPDFTGHTELIAEMCGVPDVTIMLVSPKLIVTHVSTHCSLREAIERTRRARVLRIIELTCDAVARLRRNPRVAVAGLNPHAGEHGSFGREEIDEIEPAVADAKAKGLPVEGPLPPDTVFFMAVTRGRFDAVVCMYHDQGHIPSKLLDFEGGVNMALGLPILRTSVDHGTAFDIARRGVADEGSLVEAILLAARLATVPEG
jgi:4-hydroxythreonine-4-phosphate dehydrogenase